MTDATPPEAKTRRWTRIALVASLGLNLAVIGLVAGLAFKGPPPGPGGEIGLWRYGEALPGNLRRDLVREMRADRDAWDGPRRGLRAQREALAAALIAEPYNPDAVARVLSAERDMMTALADRGTALLLAQIGRMSPQERRAYAEELGRGPRKRP